MISILFSRYHPGTLLTVGFLELNILSIFFFYVFAKNKGFKMVVSIIIYARCKSSHPEVLLEKFF